MKDFREFCERIRSEPMNHEVITDNAYTRWFAEGRANTRQVKDLFEQFSVFSMQFLPAICLKMANAEDPDEEYAARVILANEIGVELDMVKNDVEGGIFRHRDAHINWLRRETAHVLDPAWTGGPDRHLLTKEEELHFNERFTWAANLGRRKLGTPATLDFTDKFIFHYGSTEPSFGSGVSFGTEAWAAYGIGPAPPELADDFWRKEHNFWWQLIQGIKGHNGNYREPHGLTPIPTGFFQHHYDIEAKHGATVLEELRKIFFKPTFNAENWLEGAKAALDALNILWKGLDESRKELATA